MPAKSEYRSMATSSMLQGLPEEIKLNICSQFAIDGVDVSDGFHSLTALRLICRAFAYLPTEKILEVVKQMNRCMLWIGLHSNQSTAHVLGMKRQAEGAEPCVPGGMKLVAVYEASRMLAEWLRCEGIFM